MLDRELVKLAKNEDKYKNILYFRYENLCYKHLHILERQLNHKLDVKDDFMGDTYEVFLKALTAVKLKEIKNDKWLFLGWYGFYLKNLRIKYMDTIMKKSRHETSLHKPSHDGGEYIITDVAGVFTPDPYQEIVDRITYETIYKSLSQRQKRISDYKERGFKNTEIAKMLDVSNTLITFEIQDMKEIIQNAIK